MIKCMYVWYEAKKPCKVDQCHTQDLVHLPLFFLKAAALTGSGPPTNTSAMKILQRLAQITKPMKNVSSRPGEIYGGDVQIAVDMLGTLQRYNSETSGNDSLSNRTGQETFVLAASNLVDTANVKSWIQLDKVQSRLNCKINFTIYIWKSE